MENSLFLCSQTEGSNLLRKTTKYALCFAFDNSSFIYRSVSDEKRDIIRELNLNKPNAPLKEPTCAFFEANLSSRNDASSKSM